MVKWLHGYASGAGAAIFRIKREAKLMIDVTTLKFDKDGLIPAIVVDAVSDTVLMLAYMSIESLNISIAERRTCFWSRSRGELWRKGETSGNVQHIVSIKTDCDMDTLLVTVRKDGPACHTGADSCFFADVSGVTGGLGVTDGVSVTDVSGVTDVSDVLNASDVSGGLGATNKQFTLSKLYGVIEDRKANRKPGSYTTYLFDKGVDKILKKIGEESAEVIIAGKAGDKAETIYEIADLAYHAMVLMAEMGITPEDIAKELASRHVADKAEMGITPEA